MITSVSLSSHCSEELRQRNVGEGDQQHSKRRSRKGPKETLTEEVTVCPSLEFKAPSLDSVSRPLGTKVEIHYPPSAHVCPHIALNKRDKLRQGTRPASHSS